MKEGALSNLADPVAELAAVGDPALRARLATSLNRHLAALMRTIFEVRDAAVVECRPAGSVTTVASQVGLSRSRVQQVAGKQAGPARIAPDPAPICAAAAALPPAPGSSESSQDRKTAAAADSHVTVATAGESQS